MMTSPSDNLERQKLIIEDPDFIWSYSRLKKFEDCKYGWWLKYIEAYTGKEGFFSQYGTFMHDILAKYYSGELNKEELPTYYLSGFPLNVTAKAPSSKVFKSYFTSGLEFLKEIDEIKLEKSEVEKEISFNIDENNFVGFIDLYGFDENGDLWIVDHKSRALKPYSNRRSKTLSDKELDEYYKQLYLYAKGAYKATGKLPNYLVFDCFRNKYLIKEQFHSEKLEETELWASNLIKQISNNTDWSPNYDWFKCKYLCDLNEECEYFQMNNS